MLTLTLVTPEKKLLTDEPVEEVFVPGFMGELNILPGHAPLMTTLSTGVLKYRRSGSEKLEYAAISWGYCHVNANGVNILAETAETPEELETQRTEKAKKLAEQKLISGDAAPEDVLKYQLKLMRAYVRTEVAARSENKN